MTMSFLFPDGRLGAHENLLGHRPALKKNPAVVIHNGKQPKPFLLDDPFCFLRGDASRGPSAVDSADHIDQGLDQRLLGQKCFVREKNEGLADRFAPQHLHDAVKIDLRFPFDFLGDVEPPDLHEIDEGPIETVQVYETHDQDQDHENEA